MTYVQVYTGDLERAIEQGGDATGVERAIAEYNLFDADAFRRWWASHAAFRCFACGDGFKHADAPDASALVVCGSCRT